MSTTLLLIVLVVCAVAVLAGVGYAAWRGFRLARTASRTARKFSAASMDLSQRTAEARAHLEEIGARQTDLVTTLRDLQVSLARLQLVLDTLNGAVRPFRRAARYVGL